MIYVTRPSLPPFEEYIAMIKPLWESHRLTNMGAYHDEFECRLREYLNVPYISLMVNGHMALELTIQAFEFPKGAEVITTPFTFISTTHAIVRNGLTPVFCDVRESDGTMDPLLIEALITDKTVAILPVHVYGHICDVYSIQKIADKYDLKVIYDAAHAFGEKNKGKSVAGYGDASVYSFHSTKVFHSIEGGAVSTRDEVLYERLFDLKNFGFRGEELVEYAGANAKMNEFSAAMGLCNLRRLQDVIENRKKISARYDSRLHGIGYNYHLHEDDTKIKFFTDDQATEKNYAYYPILIGDGEDTNMRDRVYEALYKNRVYSRKYFYPISSRQRCYEYEYRNVQTNNAESLSNRVLCLPIYEGFEDDKVDKICEIIYGCIME